VPGGACFAACGVRCAAAARASLRAPTRRLTHTAPPALDGGSPARSYVSPQLRRGVLELAPGARAQTARPFADAWHTLARGRVHRLTRALARCVPSDWWSCFGRARCCAT
jgi:hypothetical protein